MARARRGDPRGARPGAVERPQAAAGEGAPLKEPSIIWRQTFPDSAPGTDGVAIFDGRVIGRVRLTELPHGAKWSWSVTDPELAGRPGWANTQGEMPSRPPGHGAPDRTLAGTAGL